MSTRLSININKIALLRNARGGQVPNVLKFALDCASYGADGITIHPRQDQRHITNNDVQELAQSFPKNDCEFNIEGYPTAHFVEMVLTAKPTQVTLVPDASNQLTSDHGWDVLSNFDLLKDVLETFKTAEIRTAIFIDPVAKQLELAKKVGADRIELYTGPYAEDYTHAIDKGKDLSVSVRPYKDVVSVLDDLGLGVNAGHDLNLENLKYFKENVPNLLEVSIGQAFLRDCLYYGLENTIQMYKRMLE